SWVGAAIRTPAGAVMTRSQGARDVALGAGALRALRAGDGAEARRWFAAHLVADATDLAATLAAWNGLPVGRRIFAALMAGGSAAIAAMTVAGGS
ncbi:MAG TPA: hypothetical protein VD931_18005, partial [Baekduia sp.]|nr:hypothetical protein [Baekduia sp.]